MSDTLKTSEEWQAIHSGITVVDPDGWDRRNFEFSWRQERITEREYLLRRALSSCLFGADK